MNEFLSIIGNVGPFLTAIGLFLTVWALKANHDWNRRLYAANLVAEWNDKTAHHRRVIERIRPGLVDLDVTSKDVVELTKKDANAIYTSKPEDDGEESLWELRFHLIELLNHFESITVAYRNRVGDPQMMEESLRSPLIRWHDILHNFIQVVKEHRGYEPWEPYVVVVSYWKRKPFRPRKFTA